MNPARHRERLARAALVAAALVSACLVLGLGLGLAQGGARGSASASAQGSVGGDDGGAAQQAEGQDDYRDPAEHPTYYAEGPHLEGYDFTEMPLDPDSPFYPSSATTRSGGFYSAEVLMDVERCGDAGCHPDTYGMWYESTHHLASFNDPWYKRTFQFFEERSGQRTAQWCGGCHDPAVMMTGNMQGKAPIDFEGPAANIGISCQFCHSVGVVHPAHVNASYELAPAQPLPNDDVDDDPEQRREGNRQLLESPELIAQHKAGRRQYFHSLSFFCGTCHKQSLITPVNNYKWLRGFDEFDGWQDSGISGASARSFYYPDEPMVCQTCHMPEVPSDDAGNDGGYVASHRFPGANTALAAFHGYDRQLEEQARFLQDDIVRVDVFSIETERGQVAPLDAFDVEAAPGTRLDVDVVVRTLKIGHLFPGGTVDSNMVWLELAVLDGDGEPVLMSGGMGEDRFVDPEAHFYRGVFVDEAGQELGKRNGWDRRAAVYVRMIPPGAADTVHYRFTVPEGVSGPLRLRARLNYRKHKQAYNRWAMGAEPVAQQPADAVSLPAVDTRRWTYDDSQVPELPTILLAEDEVEIDVVAAGGATAPGMWVDGSPVDGDRIDPSPDHWMRFNDHGIGLLRQADLRAAVEAFRHVQRVRPDYADAFINEARARLQEGDLAAAEAALERAEAVQPDFFKTDYFQAQVARGYGEYDRAVELLESVAEQLPYDRQVRVDLGRTYYLMGRYDEAVEHLLWILDNIDPEELGAHYNLMLSYRALGEDAKADIHESRYLRYREDEDIRRLTGPFRRDNPGANRESQAIHVHELAPPAGRFSAPERFPWTEFVEGGRYDRPPTEFPGPTPPWRRGGE